MKRLTGLCGCLLLLSTVVVGQERMRIIPQVSKRALPGIVQMPMPSLYYTYYYVDHKRPEKDKAEVVIDIFNDTLGSFRTLNVNVDKTAEIASVAYSDQNTMVVLVDPVKKRRKYMLLSPTGEVTKEQSEEGLVAEATSPDSYPAAYAISPEQFAIFYPAASRAGGYKIKAVDNELDTKWSKSFAPKTGTWTLEKMLASGPLLVTLQKEVTGTAPEEKTIYTLQGIELMSGNSMFSLPLTDSNNNLMYPTFVAANMGEVTIGGFYYKNGIFDEKKSDGIFFSVVGEPGNIMASGVLPWDSVAAAAGGNELISMLGGKSIFLPRGVFRLPPERNVIVAEILTPSVNSASQSYSLKTSEITMLQMGKEGNLEKITTLKPSAVETKVDKPIATLSDAVRYAHSGLASSYQGSFLGSAIAPYIVYTDKIKDTNRLVFRPLEDWGEKINSVPMAFQSYSKKEGKATGDIEPGKSGIVLSPQGRAIFYNYDGPELRLASKPIKKQTAEGGNTPQLQPKPEQPKPPQRPPHPHELDPNHPYNKKR